MPRKSQEGHLKDGKPQKSAKAMKSGKIMKRARKAHQSKSSKSILPLKSTPTNTLNACYAP
jgi:hypothetical protein